MCRRPSTVNDRERDLLSIYRLRHWREIRRSSIVIGLITRYRSGFPDDRGDEFDAAFTRLDHVETCLAETRFDIMWHRHTGQWWRPHSSVTLEEALHLIETQRLLQPPL
jgi:hypothetical protein